MATFNHYEQLEIAVMYINKSQKALLARIITEGVMDSKQASSFSLVKLYNEGLVECHEGRDQFDLYYVPTELAYEVHQAELI